ncbi:phage holin family protein [Virgisporangium aurantiacum]|uniref:Membrane protein n=1 Tax=Virgisporangium aurantiacum TaxID=175570 RepID=A0A8J4DZD6_9ACTN|nr:phage holin family protein [Virgisporangium aurantiacum]GIJ55616.1 membrane protein [Virgisporangium aurantiacum]
MENVDVLTARHLPRLLGIVLLDWAALGATVWLVPGISADSGWTVLVLAAVLGALAAVLRPALVRLLTRVGWAGVGLGWLLSQALFVYVALSVTPGVRVDDFWSAFWASWLYGALVSLVLWFVTAGDLSVMARHLTRVNRRYRRAAPATTVPGVLLIQVDGLSAPLAEWAVRCGNLPTLGRWLRSGSHVLTEWHAELPATTPASQAGLLHGTSDQIPAFRWYEKDAGRLVVTNRPADSAMVEARMSTGRGLLADGGVSVSNVFSGDAPTSLLTMSSAGRRGGPGRPARYLTTFLLDPFGLTHALVLTAGEMVKELHQARRQRVRNVEPRTPRPAAYVVLRGVTNVLMRHINLSIIAEHLMRGAPAVYCDFVDYDEIAHHAGPARPESLAALEGLDGVLATLELVADAAPRPYRIVVLSDHGQSQGATFLQRYGVGLDGLVRTFTPEPTVVVASGNLGMVYLIDRPGRLTMEDLDEAHPRLLPGLTGHPGIGWVMVRTRARGPVVLGPSGRHFLATGLVEGVDPLGPFGPRAADDVRRHDSLPHVGDVVVNSALDPATDEVYAFEELIGSHGGLGGWQNRPFLVRPAGWPVEGDLVGADAVHRQLLVWMGRRTPAPATTPTGPVPVPVPVPGPGPGPVPVPDPDPDPGPRHRPAAEPQ